MAFKIDGSSHRDGVQQEVDLVERINNDRNFASKICPALTAQPYLAEQKGGTKHKEDIEVTNNGKTFQVSVKKKESIKTGSFDWVNTSSAIKSNPVFKRATQMRDRISQKKPSVSIARKVFKEACNTTMKEMTSKDIKSILVDHVTRPNANKRIVVTDKTTGKFYAYDFVDDPMYAAVHTMRPYFDWGRDKEGQTSAKIVFADAQGQTHDFGLRGRLVSNNGITAMTGRSRSNSTSSVVFKIQQDKVGNIIDRIQNNKLTII